MGRKQKTKLKRTSKASNTIYALFGLVIVIGLVFFWRMSTRTPNLPKPPLKDLAQSHSVALGAHVLNVRLKDNVYRQILASQFAYVVSDREAHWDILRPSSTDYDFVKLDAVLNFANSHNMPTEVHHLLWGDQAFLPDWLKNGSYTKEQLRQLMHDHINTVLSRYKSQVATWTVVNEIFTRQQHVYGLHDWWADQLGGPTYVDDAFKWARQADPQATLLINDFNNEIENAVSNAEYAYLKGAKARGVPIDGVGMQMHINAANPPTKQAVIANMQRFATLGYKVYVTEFDVNINSLDGDAASKRSVEAQITYDMVRACIESKVCQSFDEFGITDKQDLLKSLARTDAHSYLFDSRYRPKPSFYSFRQAWQEP